MSTEILTGLFDQVQSQPEFHQLIHIGKLTKQFTWVNHTFEIRTLTIEEEVAIGQMIKHLDGAVTQEKAAVTAVVSACLVSINGKNPFPDIVMEDPILALREKYRLISANWRWPVVERINREYLPLVQEMYDQVEKLENFSVEGQAKNSDSFTDSFDPSKDPAFLDMADPTDFS